ncbi:Gfo/Idh/MocA family protein [Spirosoma pomorum]
MIRWGILGPGHIAHKFAKDLLTVPDAKLYAVASSDQQRADEFAREYDIPHAFGHYADLLTLPELDVVYVATRHIRHHDDAIMLLNGGKAVLGEKPFAMDLTQVREMVDTARSKQLFLMEALWSRFMPTVQKAREWVEAGAIGEVTGVRADFGFKAMFNPEGRLFDKKLGGGALLDIGIYPLFWSYFMLGMPQSIKATATFGSTGVDEQIGMVVTYADGEIAVLDSTLRTKTPCEAYVYGTEGLIKVHGRWHESTSLTLERIGEVPETLTFDRSSFGYDFEAKHVMDCLASGLTESPLWSLTDSLNLMTLLDQVRAEVGINY